MEKARQNLRANPSEFAGCLTREIMKVSYPLRATDALQAATVSAQTFLASLAVKLPLSDFLAGLMPAVTDRLVRVARFG
jgi:hypothetical protein